MAPVSHSLMSIKPETRIRQLKQISTAIKNLAGHTAWSHFWNVPAPENPTSGMHDDEFHDFMWDHRYEFGKAVDSPSAKPLTLTSHDIKIFELAVSIVLDVLAVAFVYPGIRIMREVRARLAVKLATDINEIQDPEFTRAALTFLGEVARDSPFKNAVVDALKELDISCHYEPSQHFNDIPEDESSQLTIRFREALAAPSDASDLWHTIEREASL